MSKYGFIGCGNMASAIIRGIIGAGLADPLELCASEPRAESAQAKANALGIMTTTDNVAVVQQNKVVFLAVKPQVLGGVLEQIRDEITDEHLIICMAAGKTIAWVEEQLGKPAKIVRIMPNTPAFVGKGMTGYCANENVTPEDLAVAEEILDSFGRKVQLPEHLIDAETAVGGCAPAFVYLFIEALADGGVAEGLPRAEAVQIAAQTVLGSAAMVLETGKHPGQLKDEVCSPGGSTIVGVEALEKGAFRGTTIDAVRSAAEASRGLK